MKREDIIDYLRDINAEFNKILPYMNIEEDVEDFFSWTKAFARTDLNMQFINYLSQSGNSKVLEENVQYIPSEMWSLLKDNKDFKNAFINNFDKIVRNNRYIDFEDMKDIIDEDKEEDFYKNNIFELIKSIKCDTAFFISHLINDTNFGEELLVENQLYLFRNIEYVCPTLESLKKQYNIDAKIFLNGIVENFEYITQKEKYYFCKFLNIAKEIVEKSDLEEKEIEDIKQKIQKTIVKDGKLNEDLIKNIVDLKDAKALENIRYFGVDKQILRNEQDMFLNTFIGQEMIEYIGGCEKYEGIPKEYSLKELVKRIFYGNEIILNDEPTMYAIKTLITEIAKAQGLAPFHLERGGDGAYNTNLKIGEFIFKVGRPRETRRIPYHKRIMQPIIRQETDPDGINNLCVELQNVGDPNWYNHMSEEEIEEELYKIFSELRDDGIIWTDIKKENVVRLLRPNKLNFKLNGEEIGRNEDSVEMMNLKDEEPLPAGELVVADTDFVCYENEWNEYPHSPEYSLFCEFENRYKKEHEKPKEEIEFE